MMQAGIFVLMMIFSSFTFICIAQDVRRGRNEGTFNIPASNVAGNGNINLYSTFQGIIGESGSLLKSKIAAAIGITDILQFNISASVVNFKKIGATEARCQFTLPNNDGLRFLGFALCGDLFLSTTMDTISGEATSGRPDFHSFFRPSLIFDQDWIAVNKQTRIKTYQSLGMADDAELLFQYEQVSLKLGAELKSYQHSFFTDIGIGLYREKPTGIFSGDKGFKQQRVWVEPGVRLRAGGRFSILGSLKILVLQRVKNWNPLPAQYLGLSFSFEAPIYYKETNTEAIRTLIFIDNAKDMAKDRITRTIEQRKSIKTDFEIGFEELAPGDSVLDQQQETLRKKEEIHEKMEEIELLLEGLE